MAIQSAAGSTISISQTSGVATVNLAGFQAKVYDVIGEVTTIPAFGKTYNLITHNPIGTRYTKKLKGSYNNGSVSIDYAKDPLDAGQIRLTLASNSDASYCYRVVLQDGNTYYFTAQALSNTLEVGSVDSIIKGVTMLEIDSEIVED